MDRDILTIIDRIFYEMCPPDTRLWTNSFQFAIGMFPVINTKQVGLTKSIYFFPDLKNAISAQFIQLYTKRRLEKVR